MIHRYLNSLSLTVLIVNLSIAEEFLGPDTTLCTDQCIELSIFASPNGVFPVWSTGDSTTSITVCHNPDTSEQIIWVEVMEDNAAGDPPIYHYDTIKITMVTTTPPLAPPFDSVETCIGSCITLSGPSGGIKYIWNPYTGIDESDTANVCINIPKIKYKVSVITDTINNCRYDYFINVRAAVRPTDTMYHSITLCKDSCTELKAPSGGQKYNWFPTIWLSDSKVQMPIICPEEDTIYIISTITDTTIDCQYIDTLTVTVNKDEECSMTGINQSFKKLFNLFPNPTSGDLTIDLSEGLFYINVTISIYDFTGRKIIIYDKINTANERIQLDLKSLVKGIYYLSLNTGDQLYYSEKLLIQ